MRKAIRSVLAVVFLPACGLLAPGPLWGAETETAKDEQTLKAAKIGTDGPALLEFFRKRTPNPADEKRIAALVKDLGSSTFRVRLKATKELTATGPNALPALRRALKDKDVEVQSRAKQCIATIERQSPPALARAAVRLLAVRKPANACAVLLAYLPFAADEDIEEEVRTALPALGGKDGKADAALVAALKDKLASRRAAAASAVAQVGSAEQRQAVRALLKDRDNGVRFQAAQGLVYGNDKTAVPVLVAMLGEGPLDLALKAEDLLSVLAGAEVTKVELKADAASRKKVHQAWAAWWKANEAKIDLKKGLNARAARVLRARRVAKRCVDSLRNLDIPAFKKTLHFPMYMQGGPNGKNQAKTEKDIDQVFAQLKQVPEEVKKQFKMMKFNFKKVVGVDDYLKVASPAEKNFLKQFRKADLLIVHVDITMTGMGKGMQATQNTSLFVRLVGGRAYVNGFGDTHMAAQKKMQPPKKKKK
jgi:HEAT repeat protein